MHSAPGWAPGAGDGAVGQGAKRCRSLDSFSLPPEALWGVGAEA